MTFSVFYEFITRYKDSIVLNFETMILDAIVLSVFASLPLAKILSSIYKLTIHQDKIVWSYPFSQDIFDMSDIVEVKVYNFLLFKYLKITSESRRVFVPLLFLKNEIIINKLITKWC
jgi:hypothetical protein